MQTLQEKPRQTKILKLVIVGADGRKWNGNQEARMKEYIGRQLKSLLYGKELIVGEIKFKENELWDAKLKRVEFDELIVVSGHCPVGEERWFDITFNDWFPKYLKEAKSWAEEERHKVVKVFDEGGVDTEVEIACAKLGIKTEIYPAPAMQWEDKKDILIELKTSPVEHFINGLKNIRYSPLLNVDMIADLMGYKSRNIVTANVCDILFDIEPSGKCSHCGGIGHRGVIVDSNSGNEYFIKCKYCEGDGAYSGGTWTLKYARKLGKEVHKVIIE